MICRFLDRELEEAFSWLRPKVVPRITHSLTTETAEQLSSLDSMSIHAYTHTVSCSYFTNISLDRYAYQIDHMFLSSIALSASSLNAVRFCKHVLKHSLSNGEKSFSIIDFTHTSKHLSTWKTSILSRARLRIASYQPQIIKLETNERPSPPFLHPHWLQQALHPLGKRRRRQLSHQLRPISSSPTARTFRLNNSTKISKFLAIGVLPQSK